MSVGAELRAGPVRLIARFQPATRGWIGFGLLLVAALAMLVYFGRGTGFYFDEWDWIGQRREWDADALLQPHNEHLSLVPLLAFKLLFSSVGIESYVPYRLAGLAMHALVAGLLFVYARRRVGDLPALAAAALLLLLGPAWQGILWPFQIGYLGSLAAGLGSLLALDRGDRHGDALACGLLAVAVASSSLGLPLLAAVAIEVLGRPDRRRRWWVIAVPAALYAVWWIAYGGESELTRQNLFDTPRYVADATAGAVGALLGLGLEWGRTMALGLLVIFVLAVRRSESLSWRLLVLLAMPLAFWGLTGLARADLGEPAASRYLYPGGLFILLVAVEAAAGARFSRRAATVGAVVLSMVLLSNLGAMREGGSFLRGETAKVEGALSALPLVRSAVDSDFQPALEAAPQIRAAPYMAAARDLGSPVPPTRTLHRQRADVRAAADAMLLRGYGLALADGASGTVGAAPRLDVTEAARARPSGPCQVITSLGGQAMADLIVPRGGLLFRPAAAGFSVALRRFGDAYPDEPIGTVGSGAAPVALRIPRDGSPRPWRAQVKFGEAVRVCRQR